MKITRFTAPVAVAATLLVTAAGASASAPSYVGQIDRICAAVPATPNLDGTVSAANIKNVESTITIFNGLIKPLNAVHVPSSTAGGKAVLAWATDVGKADGYLGVGLKYAKAGNTNAFDTYLEKALSAAKAGKTASTAAGLTGC